MSRSHALVAAAALVLMSTVTASTFAQAPAAPAAAVARKPLIVTDARFNALRDNTIRLREDVFKEVIKEVSSRDPFPSAALQAPALNRASSVTAIELATVALQTSVAGAEAGISVAPLALAGFDKLPVQVNLTFAALKDLKTEYGTAVAYQTPWNPLTPGEVGLAECPSDKGWKEKLTKAINDISTPLKEICQIVDTIDSLPRMTASESRAAALEICKTEVVCTEPKAGGPECEGVSVLITYFNKALTKDLTVDCDNVPGYPPGQTAQQPEGTICDAKLRLDKLLTFRKDYPPPDCYSGDDIGDALVKKNWTHPRYAFGVGATFDLFPKIFGFNPDEEKALPGGELSKFLVRAEWARTTGRFELHLGFGVGRSRAELDKPLYNFISPSLSLTWAVASLSKEDLMKDDKLNVIKGAPPPRFALGLDAQLDYGLTRPDTQVTSVQAVAVTGYVDFRFTDKLGVRLGVPITGKLVTRSADTKKTPAVTEQTDLQWSLPVFATTVLKL